MLRIKSKTCGGMIVACLVKFHFPCDAAMTKGNPLFADQSCGVVHCAVRREKALT